MEYAEVAVEVAICTTDACEDRTDLHGMLFSIMALTLLALARDLLRLADFLLDATLPDWLYGHGGILRCTLARDQRRSDPCAEFEGKRERRSRNIKAIFD